MFHPSTVVANLFSLKANTLLPAKTSQPLPQTATPAYPSIANGVVKSIIYRENLSSSSLCSAMLFPRIIHNNPLKWPQNMCLFSRDDGMNTLYVVSFTHINMRDIPFLLQRAWYNVLWDFWPVFQKDICESRPMSCSQAALIHPTGVLSGWDQNFAVFMDPVLCTVYSCVNRKDLSPNCP